MLRYLAGQLVMTGVHCCRNFWVLIGTASTWFLLDIAFYSQNLFLPNILEGIGYNPKINLPASKCVKTKTCPHYNLPVSPPSPSIHPPSPLCNTKCASKFIPPPKAQSHISMTCIVLQCCCQP